MASFFAWFTRCLPALSVIVLFGLVYSCFIVDPYGARTNGIHQGRATYQQYFLSIYIVALHIFSTLFPIRLCFAIYDVLTHLRATHNAFATVDKKNDPRPDSPALGGRFVIHAILIPNYKEDMETLSDTLRVLAAHPRAHTLYDVGLGGARLLHQLTLSRSISRWRILKPVLPRRPCP